MIVIWVAQGRGGTGAGIAQVIESVPRQLYAASESVLEPESVEPRGEVGLAVQNAFRGVAFRPASGDAGDDSPGSAGGGSHAGDGGYAHIEVPADVAIPKRAAQVELVAKAMVQADRAHIRVSFLVVVFGQAIPGIPVNPHGLTIEKRKTVVRNVVLVLKKVIEGHLCRRAKAEGEGWSESLAGYFDMISVDDIGVLGHGVYPQSDRGREWLVDVRGAAEVRAATGVGRSIVEALETGGLADLVDDTAGGAPPEIDRCGPLEHFDGLDIKGVSEISTLIAHPIEVHIVARAETAQGEVVALSAAAFACRDADAGDITHRIAQGGRRLFLENLPWHNGDGLGNVLDRLGQTLQSQVRHDIGINLVGDYHRGQGEFLFLFLFRPEGISCQSERKRHGSADTLTGGKSDLVEDFIPPSFIGAFFLSTHGSSNV